MNIVILAAGLGTRFKDFILPKPLIDVNGQPMLTQAIRTLGIDGYHLFVIRHDQYIRQTFNAVAAALNEYCIYPINYVTEGAAATALLLKTYINNDQELIITNCDQVMNWDSDKALTELRKYDAGVVTINNDDPKHSYVELKNGLAVKFAEKEVISEYALTGIHYWKQGSDFVTSAEEMIAKNLRAANGEFYIAPTYNQLINSGKRVGIYNIEESYINFVGTPQDLERYINESREII